MSEPLTDDDVVDIIRWANNRKAIVGPDSILALCRDLQAARAAIAPVVLEAAQKVNADEPNWNPEAHVEITLTIAEIRALMAAGAKP